MSQNAQDEPVDDELDLEYPWQDYDDEDDDDGDYETIDLGPWFEPKEWVPPIGTDVSRDFALLATTVALIGPVEGPTSLWFFLVEPSGALSPLIVPFDGLPRNPEPLLVDRLVHGLGDELTGAVPGSELVLALVRAAGGDRGTVERSWSEALRRAATSRHVPLREILAVGADRARFLR